MTRRGDRLAWLPPLLAGGAAALAGEMAAGLLLYVRSGLVGALTLVLSIEMAALGLGLWSAPRDGAPPWAGVRRAWLLLLLTYVAAAVVAAGWDVLGGLAGSALTRGAGLAFLAALPLYATGLVLGASGWEGVEGSATGAPAALGAALGFLGGGVIGIRLALVASAYVACVIAVSAGALVHSHVLAERERRWRAWAETATADAAPPERADPGPGALP